MPFPFVLPTTSSFSFSSCYRCSSHPSLTTSASTQRGVVREVLKKHKRLPPTSQAPNLSSVVSSLDSYIPYLFAIDAGLTSQPVGSELISIGVSQTPVIEWRPTISGEIVPGRERMRVKVTNLEHEIRFVLSTLGFAYSALARSSLQPLYSTTADFMGSQERTAAITTATKYLMDSASVHDFLANRQEQTDSPPPCADVAPSTARAMASLTLAEATLLAILKDDPYPSAVAQGRNKTDKEWMYKAPDIPKVRAHLFARLALAAAEHAGKAASLCLAAGSGNNKVSTTLIKYIEDLRRTSRAKACRFFGIDAELGGQTAEGIGWVRAGLKELGVEAPEAKKGLSFSKLKKDISEKREDKRVDKEASWGLDGGRLEETRILELLDAKWNKINDTMNTQHIPPINSLLSKMPSGRDVHTIRLYEAPTLDRNLLDAVRAPPQEEDHIDGGSSSDDETRIGISVPVGAFPGTPEGYGSQARPSENSYY